MRVNIDRNLAFQRQPKPIPVAELRERVRTRRARKRAPVVEVDLDMFLPTRGELDATAAIRRTGRGRAARQDLVLTVRNFEVGKHVFPPNIRAKSVATLGNKSRRFSKPLQVRSYLPDHLVRRPVPRRLPRDLVVQPFFKASTAEDDPKRGNQATTIFGSDDRMVFNDTSYPWSACGRVDTPIGQSSGVVVGPRHIVMASHAIQWNADGSAGWVQFRPSFFNGSTPFGQAWGTWVYYKRKVRGPTIDWVEGMYDYVCVVLNANIGNLTGWMGARGYTDSWDGGAYWAHIGYPGDLTSGNRPTFENGIALDGAWWQFDSHEAMSHRGDVWPGQSGGPFFGWWAGEVGPRVVALQSSQNSSENNASGGQDMVDLIIRARNEFP